MAYVKPVLLLIFLIFINVTCFISAIKLLVNVMQSSLTLKKKRRNGEEVIRCSSSVYKLKYYIFYMLLEIFTIYILLKPLYNFKHRAPILFYLTLPLFLSLIIRIIIHAVAVFREKYAYLTSEGLIFFIGRFKFEKCRFVWESSDNPDIFSNTLHIYPPKEKLPFTVFFDEQLEEAHRIVSDNSV